MRGRGWKACCVALLTLNVRLAPETEPERSSSRFCAVVTLVPVNPGSDEMPGTGTLGFATLTVGIWYHAGLSVPFHPRDDVFRSSKPLLKACLHFVQLIVSA